MLLRMSTYKKKLLSIGIAAAFTLQAQAQQSISGRVLNSDNQPIADVVISCPGCSTVRTDADGRYLIEGVKEGSSISYWHDGYYTQQRYVKKPLKHDVNIFLVSTGKTRYNETTLLPYQTVESDPSIAGIANINRKDFASGSLSIDRVLEGAFTGLQATNKSGMTGEGACLQLRGIKSLVAENSPLIVINGVPYMPDLNESQIIGGYSRSAFQALNNLDIRNITVLKGAEAAIYGSMGSNGVILIETDQATSDNMNTRISFSAIVGTNWNNRRIPLMNSQQYKNYLSDVGLTYYDNMEAFFNDFTFLTDPNANQHYLYEYDTDWQKEIYRNSTTMDYLFRVEGGDNIAKYNISLGYMGDKGTLKKTYSDRYNAQINASVLVSKKVEIQAAINTAYLRGQYQEQGMSYETSPLLSAYRHSPLLSPWKSDMYGNLINTYASYWYGAIKNEDFIVSNPLSIVNTLTGKNRQYDINAKIQLSYKPTNSLSFNGLVGMYYNYNQEEAFIPGINNSDIVPLFDQYGKAENTIRVGTNHTFNMFYNLNAAWNKHFTEKHKLAANIGFQSIMTNYEYDAAFARNSNNDFYQTLGDAQTLGKNFSGYNNKWNWLDFYAHANYTLDNFVKLGVTASYDAATSIGEDATRFSLYPAADVVFMLKRYLADDFVNRLNVYANYGITGNSRFSSKYGKYYYTSQPYQTIAGIIRANVPNTRIKAEKDHTLNLGIESSLWNNRLQLAVGYYDVRAKDVLITGVRSSVMGTSTYFNNDGEISARGVEVSLSVTPVSTKQFKWTIGGNFTSLKNQVESLGTISEILTTLSDNAEIITRVGQNPYAFYGYKTAGVFSTTAEAEAANLTNRSGVKYAAGDVHYVDVNGDGIINDADKQVIGSATPDFYGSLFTRFEYKHFALDLNFTYSHGNDIYNAVRRVTESGSDFSNQSTSLIRRWSMEGQMTDIPRASWGDKVGNNVFSDRWIEDGSYIKLSDITFSYTWDKPLLNFIQGGTAFVTGQNLLTFSNYLGLDPETSYSYSSLMQGIDYGKVASPRSVKIGINLRF
ncbi:MAG: SusC/RagA family TonB-linked outer membrane protein [Bacteroidaceae bacterium]|nr:SusC/RagA family TonB-linked outer membrane protein [Bacteroidaceae bacterium]